ncbi:MAG: hypothetical protein L3J73_01595, partial [Thermoplasmata archaeon]|nr:hypothetical protein [Thermoplasmata archaeon]
IGGGHPAAPTTSPAAAPVPPLGALRELGRLPSALPLPEVGAQGRLIVGTSDIFAVPNDGLRVNLTPFSEPPLGTDASFQAGVEETIGGFDAVFGLFENTATAPIPFFTVFSNTTDQTVHLAYWPNATTLPESTYDFELTRTNGTVWELQVNHAIFGGNATAGQFDFGATSSTWLGGLGFSEIALYPTTSSAPSMFSVPLAMAVHQASGWYLPVEAHATFTNSGGPAWGIEGRLQHPSLPPGSLVSGTSVASVPNGTVLWTGGPIGVSVAVAVPSDAPGFSNIAGSVSVTTSTGAPIPGATVFLSDQLGGSFTPSSIVTGGAGGGSFAFGTPNVTQSGTDNVRALVTTFGFTGVAETTVALTPARQVFVRALATGPAVAPGTALDLSFVAQDAGGLAVAGIGLSFGTSAGRLLQNYGVTASDGTVTTTLIAPNASGALTVRAIVSGGGIWGGTSVNVTVRSPAPSLLSPLVVALSGIAVAVLAALAAVMVFRRRRARRPPVPPLRLPRPPPKGPP